MSDPLLETRPPLSQIARRTFCRLAVMDLFPNRIMHATREGAAALGELERAGLISPLQGLPGMPLWINDKGRRVWEGKW